MTEKDMLMWFLSISGISSKLTLSVLKQYQSFHPIWNLPERELGEGGLFSSKQIESIQESKRIFDFALYKEKMRRLDIHFISIFEDDFPNALRYIPNPPLGIYLSGKLKDEFLENHDMLTSVSMIGSRRHSLYGIEVARRLSFELAERGYVIVSGMAKGIDGASHEGALQARGKTIAVLGSGIDICYPKEHESLYQGLIDKGMLLSEYPLEEASRRYHFPERNRLISGLSAGLVVVEAGQRSGTSITVNHALEQGREVLAVPGSIYSENSYGTNKLIFEGATPALSVDQIIFAISKREDFLKMQAENIQVRSEKKKKPVKQKEPAPNKASLNERKDVSQLAPNKKIVYDCICENGTTVDDLVTETDFSAQTLLPILLELEMGQYIKKIPGQQYIRKS